ncbi:hypothetical protein, partial [Mycobacterium sp.]|uniref:hypothetical protein n=1 Tax=Mycobacterium sp. TaxID=1785 RepID=UPI003A83E777
LAEGICVLPTFTTILLSAEVFPLESIILFILSTQSLPGVVTIYFLFSSELDHSHKLSGLLICAIGVSQELNVVPLIITSPEAASLVI